MFGPRTPYSDLPWAQDADYNTAVQKASLTPRKGNQSIPVGSAPRTSAPMIHTRMAHWAQLQGHISSHRCLTAA